jgi:hypothetical protein
MKLNNDICCIKKSPLSKSLCIMKSLLVSIVAAVVLVGCGGPSAPDISIWEAVKNDNIKTVKQHLAAGTDVDAKTAQGLTPLHVAAIEGHKEILKLLIAKGADVDAKDKRGRTPLVYAKGAAIKLKRTDEIPNLLRKHGAK